MASAEEKVTFEERLALVGAEWRNLIDAIRTTAAAGGTEQDAITGYVF